jgi:hypothetical protein
MDRPGVSAEAVAGVAAAASVGVAAGAFGSLLS